MSINKFDEWFEKNKTDLENISIDGNYEIMYQIWSAGYSAGKDSMSQYASELSWYKNPDRSGGQFTNEEIARGECGGDGW